MAEPTENSKKASSGDTTELPDKADDIKSIGAPESSGAMGGAFDLRRFGTDVLTYAAGQGLLLLFGFIGALIIPKYLSVEGYGYWQLFMLYGAYIGILHLGFVDGILVRWAGKELNQVSGEVKTAFIFLLLELVAITVPLSLSFYFLFHPPLRNIALLVLLYASILNLATFFMFAAQAVRKFKLLTAINVGRGGIFLLFIIVVFVLGYLDYYHVVFAFLGSHFLALVILVFWFRKPLRSETLGISSLWTYGKENINIGIFVLLGNFVAVLFMTIDRLMVSSFFPIERFAAYAFALTIATVVYTFVRAVSQVLFPYLSASATELRTRAYRLAKPSLILAWAAILAIYFPVSRLIEFYLPAYIGSLPIMQILLCTVGFGSLIQILHVNYYKVYRKQRRYFSWGVSVLAVAALLNFLAIKIFGTLESVAIATLVSFGVWYIVNEFSLKTLVRESDRELWRGLGIVLSYLGAFWLASFVSDWFIAQMLAYLGFFSLITWIFLRSEVKELTKVGKGLFNRHN